MRSASIPREILALAAVAFCVALGFGVVTPAIPLFAQQFGVGATAAGAVVSAFAFMRLVFGPFGGRLVDKLGERVALVTGLGVVAVSSLLAGLAQNYPQLLVLRAIGGIGSTVFTVAATSLVIRVAAAQLRGRAMSVYQSGFLLGGIIGPAAGGAVLGLSLRAPFFFYAGTLALACVVGLVFMRAMRQPSAEPDSGVDLAATEPVIPPMRLRAALRMPAYIAALASNLAVGFALFGMRSALVPLLIVDEIGVEPSWVGWSFFVSSIVQTGLMFPAGKLVDTVGRRLPLIGGAFVTAVGLAMLGLDGSLEIGRLEIVMAAMVVLGVGGAFLGPVPGALLGDVVTGRGGTVVAVSQMVGDVGAVLGPLAAGLLVEYLSFGAAFGLGAAVVAAAGLFGFVLPRTVAGQPLDSKQGSA